MNKQFKLRLQNHNENPHMISLCLPPSDMLIVLSANIMHTNLPFLFFLQDVLREPWVQVSESGGFW